MQANIVIENTEQRFINALESYGSASESRCLLLCKFSMFGKLIDPDEFQYAVKEPLYQQDTDIYFFENFDVGIAWRNEDRKTVDQIKAGVLKQFSPLLESVQSKDFFEIFLTQLNAEDLSAHFQRRLKESQDLANVRNGVSTATTANFTLAQEAAIGRALSNRKQRAKHEMLVVEDQGFSRLLLVGILEKNFKCHSASNASQAINLFANHAPDIVFLDVELPDVSGHELARLFKEFDRNSFIVMVTANSNVRDVELAKQNRVQGFIIKPFSKQKIQSVIESYLKTLNKTKDTL